VFPASGIPLYIVPGAFVVVHELPLTPNGKVDRPSLPEPPTERPHLATPYAPPEDETEVFLASLWADVLGIDHVGRNDNFFDLGGDSIRAVELTALAAERGRKFTLRDLFDAQTIALLAASMRAQYLHSTDPSLRVQTHP
jgi:aryl carrier-like protein